MTSPDYESEGRSTAFKDELAFSYHWPGTSGDHTLALPTDDLIPHPDPHVPESVTTIGRTIVVRGDIRYGPSGWSDEHDSIIDRPAIGPPRAMSWRAEAWIVVGWRDTARAYFRLLLVGSFEGIDSERGSDGLVGGPPPRVDEAPPDHSHDHAIDLETHRTVGLGRPYG